MHSVLWDNISQALCSAHFLSNPWLPQWAGVGRSFRPEIRFRGEELQALGWVERFFGMSVAAADEHNL